MTLDITDAPIDMRESVEQVLTMAASEMLNHRFDDYPLEAVGILCVDGSVYPLINQARSAHRFEVSQILVREAIEALNRRGFSPIAVYHSHPTSSTGPSTRDVELMSNMPGVLSVIIGLDGITAWRWEDGLQSVARIELPERKVDGEPT